LPDLGCLTVFRKILTETLFIELVTALTIVPKAAKEMYSFADFSCIQYGIIDQYSSKKGSWNINFYAAFETLVNVFIEESKIFMFIFFFIKEA
jgi:hypothetical protein